MRKLFIILNLLNLFFMYLSVDMSRVAMSDTRPQGAQLTGAFLICGVIFWLCFIILLTRLYKVDNK